MIDVDIMQDASEIVHYDIMGTPVYIRKGLLSLYPDMRALCHWHEDIELIYILKGEMNYDINGKTVLLKENDSILINARQMHYGYSNQGKDCRFICILFHPDVLNCNQRMYQEYVLPIIENSSIEYLYYENDNTMGDFLKKIYRVKVEDQIAYEYEAIGLFYALWQKCVESCRNSLNEKADNGNSDITLQKKMVSYIYQHYAEALSLEDIASAGNISRSKCCIIFKKYLQQSPVDFLNAYRLEVSRHLLKGTSYHITQIATSCGFNHLSYFSKMFMDKYGCTPSEYRKS